MQKIRITHRRKVLVREVLVDKRYQQKVDKVLVVEVLVRKVLEFSQVNGLKVKSYVDDDDDDPIRSKCCNRNVGRGQRKVNRLHPRRMNGAEVERVEVHQLLVENK